MNADVIAQGLAAFDPRAAVLEAGRIMPAHVSTLIGCRKDLAFESTLANVTVRRLLRRALGAGYRVLLSYFRLPTAELSIERVRSGVIAGGHDVPEETIRRRFGKGLRHF